MQHGHLLVSSLDNGGQINNTYLDMAKAFDKLPQEKLLYKLRYYGFPDTPGLYATTKPWSSIIFL